MTWSGSWVAHRLDARLVTDDDSTMQITQLVGLALRRNPRRAHLLVSTVLGKHIPTDPRIVYDTGRLLGARTADVLADGTGATEAITVLGYAETATGLGHLVADALDAPYLHSTRRPDGGPVAGGFEEAHSHATSHLLLPEDPALLDDAAAIVLVDDELSTGRTALNTIRLLQQAQPDRGRYVVAALVDLRSPEDRAAFSALAAELGTRIDVVALATGRVELPDDVLARGRFLVAEYGSAQAPVTRTPKVPQFRTITSWPKTAKDGGRHGFHPADRAELERAAKAIADELAIDDDARVLVLGFEELMYAPLRIACHLAELGTTVHYSTTTRSPVLPVNDEGYAIRSAITFGSHDDPADGRGARYAYNVDQTDPTDIVLVIDDEADTPDLHADGGLLAQLGTISDRVHVVVIPAHRRRQALPTPLHGPDFGSYRADEVSWLLTDLSAAELEAPIEEREEAIQSGGAHYAESLPIEYQPSAQYQSLYDEALAESARKVATAVGIVTEQVLAERGPNAVLVSLARAGTPVGILMRRWALLRHGLELPHYAVSIVRGRGIDTVALRYLAARHDPVDVMFVDGWTGKGAITRELEAAIIDVNQRENFDFSPELAVLADTGSCVSIFGTREDYLIPSACLNSTVSGLVSRTVLNGLIGPNQFHGAKFYRDLAGADVSNGFLDAVSAEFDHVSQAVDRHLAEKLDRKPTWSGWRTVEQLSEQYGIGNVNLVKPGVGETTRVLLRRVPWKVLIRRDAAPGLGHLVLLAKARNVDVELVDELSYSCVGLIHPGYRLTQDPTAAPGT